VSADRPLVAYKVLTAGQMETLAEQGRFDGAPVDLADGYVHLSTAGQLTGTVDRHFAGQGDLYVAAIDLAAHGDAVRWEESRGGQFFPHLYAPLTLASVIAHGPLERDDAGNVRLPVAA
jgi:uncharacterized protein (DUF952 family)